MRQAIGNQNLNILSILVAPKISVTQATREKFERHRL